MFRVATAALLGLALTTAMPAYAGSGEPAAEQGSAAIEKAQQPDETLRPGAREAAEESATAPTPARYRVGARVEGTYRFTHPSGVPLQVLPFLPGGFPGYGF